MPVPIRSVKFWINAFIPRHVPGYTITVPNGPYQGQTMIPGPGAVNLDWGVEMPATINDWMRGLSGQPGVRYRRQRIVDQSAIGVSDCYLTDQRSFSNEIDAESRMHSEFTVSFDGDRVSMSEWHDCDPTVELDCEDCQVECREKGDKTRMRFELQTRTNPAIVNMDCAANNPCSPTSRLFGDIDYHGTITVDQEARSIELQATIDAFPAFEAYATINHGAGVALMQLSPPAGNTVMNLPGGANRRVHYKLEDRDSDALFETLTNLGGQ